MTSTIDVARVELELASKEIQNLFFFYSSPHSSKISAQEEVKFTKGRSLYHPSPTMLLPSSFRLRAAVAHTLDMTLQYFCSCLGL